MTRKRIIALLSVMLVVGVALAVVLSVQGKPGYSSERPKPCGTYVGIMGDPCRWVCTIVPDDPACNTLTAVMEYAEGDTTVLGLFPDADSRTNQYFKCVRTGKNTYDATGVQYGIENTGWFIGEVLYISVSSGPMTFSDDGNIMSWSGTHATFSAEKDVDMDGFPDEGKKPDLCFPGSAEGKRVQVIPPYPPTI